MNKHHTEQRPLINIHAVPKTGDGPFWVTFVPEIKGMNEPARFIWHFGDGEEAALADPETQFHYYEYGVYSVILEVIDRKGERYTASVKIDATSPG